jgi:hypothetical protein
MLDQIFKPPVHLRWAATKISNNQPIFYRYHIECRLKLEITLFCSPIICSSASQPHITCNERFIVSVLCQLSTWSGDFSHLVSGDGETLKIVMWRHYEGIEFSLVYTENVFKYSKVNSIFYGKMRVCVSNEQVPDKNFESRNCCHGFRGSLTKQEVVNSNHSGDISWEKHLGAFFGTPYNAKQRSLDAISV